MEAVVSDQKMITAECLRGPLDGEVIAIEAGVTEGQELLLGLAQRDCEFPGIEGKKIWRSNCSVNSKLAPVNPTHQARYVMTGGKLLYKNDMGFACSRE